MWFHGETQTITDSSKNGIWTNPVTFLVFFTGFGVALGRDVALTRLDKVWKACAVIAVAGQVLKLLPWLNQDTSLTVALCAPVVFGMALVTHKVKQMMDEAA